VKQKMNEENKIGYYAIIPSTVLFNEDVKANEKLLYAVITVLANKEGYCFASNGYLAGLLNAQPHTVSKWVSHLKELGFVFVDIIKNDKGEIIQRRIYPNDTPYAINRTYPYSIERTKGMSQKGQYNNISINKIDRLFNYIIKKEQQIPEEFLKIDSEEIFNMLKKYELLYTEDNVKYISKDNLDKIKTITYIVALMVKDNLQYLSNKISRDKLLLIYNECKLREEEYKKTGNEIENFINYYYKSVINELTRDNSPSFFMSKNKEIEEIGGFDI